jgi:hypothetical protein
MWKLALSFVLIAACAVAQPKAAPQKEAAMKADLIGQIDAMKKRAQVMVDSVFSFGELGFQEFETSKYLTNVLEGEGFKIERTFGCRHFDESETGRARYCAKCWLTIAESSLTSLA